MKNQLELVVKDPFFSLKHMRKIRKTARLREMEISALLCFHQPNSCALPLMQSDSCTRPPPSHCKFYCFHLLLFSGFPLRINVYSLSVLILCSANCQADIPLPSIHHLSSLFLCLAAADPHPRSPPLIGAGLLLIISVVQL